MQAYYRHLQSALVRHFKVDEDMPFGELPETFKDALYFGTGDEAISMDGSNGSGGGKARPFEGLVPQMQRLYRETESEFTRNRIRAFMRKVACSTCGGARLKPEILAVTIRDDRGIELNIHTFTEQTVGAGRELHGSARPDRSAEDHRGRGGPRNSIAPAIPA